MSRVDPERIDERPDGWPQERWARWAYGAQLEFEDVLLAARDWWPEMTDEELSMWWIAHADDAYRALDACEMAAARGELTEEATRYLTAARAAERVAFPVLDAKLREKGWDWGPTNVQGLNVSDEAARSVMRAAYPHGLRRNVEAEFTEP